MRKHGTTRQLHPRMPSDEASFRSWRIKWYGNFGNHTNAEFVVIFCIIVGLGAGRLANAIVLKINQLLPTFFHVAKFL